MTNRSDHLPPLDYFFFAGEPSGDLHGAALIKNIKKRDPSKTFYGVGGNHMRAENMECFLCTEDFSVMGFFDLIPFLPKLIKAFFRVKKEIIRRNPKCVVLIDYAEFNLIMAKRLRKSGYRGKIVQYISPSVWAWRRDRIYPMAKNLNLLMTILPFEPDYYKETSLTAVYVGNPLVAKVSKYKPKEIAIPKDRTICSLYPGSRSKEIKRNFPYMLRAAENLLNDDTNLFFPISVSLEKHREEIKKQLSNSSLIEGVHYTLFPHEQAYEWMGKSDFAIAKCGTIILELALHNVPTCVIFAIPARDRILGQYVLRIKEPKYFSLPNIIAQKRIFPEFLGHYLTDGTLFEGAKQFLNAKARSNCRDNLKSVKKLLGAKDASAEGAKHLLEIL